MSVDPTAGAKRLENLVHLVKIMLINGCPIKVAFSLYFHLPYIPFHVYEFLISLSLDLDASQDGKTETLSRFLTSLTSAIHPTTVTVLLLPFTFQD